MFSKRLCNSAYAIIALSLSYPSIAETIKLDGSNTLIVSTNKKITSVVLMYEKTLQESMNIGNSMTGQVKSVSLCRSCEKVYVISVPDVSSTYGYETHIIVFSDNQSKWGIQKIPISAKLVKARNANNYLLKASLNYYEFRGGFLHKINNEIPPLSN